MTTIHHEPTQRHGEKVPNIAIIPNTETIASCNACGENNYIRAKRDDSHHAVFMPRPSVKLWDLRICPNGVQTFVIKLCRPCLAAIRNKVEDVLKEDA
jgi:hypothetical protein